MANTAITLTSLALNTATLNTAGTAIVAANTHVITPTKRLGKVLIRITNTTASQKVATILAGDNPPADAAGQGNLTVTLAAGDTTPTFGHVVLESARFLQNDGTVQITVDSGTTGFIAALQLP